MDLKVLNVPPGAVHKRKRVGRGRSSGHGKTCTRGQNGQKARTSVPPWFEGGQMPITRRVPKRGFTPPRRTRSAYVNVAQLNRFPGGTTVDPELLKKVGLIKRAAGTVRVLGSGQLTAALTVRAHHFTEQARSRIEGAGGTVEVI